MSIERRQADVIAMLEGIARSKKKLQTRERLAIKFARANGLTRAIVAEKLGMSEGQVDWLDEKAEFVARAKARPSTATERPGMSSGEYAKLHGLTRDAVQKQIQSGALKTVKVAVGKRIYKRIISD